MSQYIRPVITYDDNIFFYTRFSYCIGDDDCLSVFDTNFLLTRFGLYIPTNLSNYGIAKYLKDPSKENKERLNHLQQSVYLVSPSGALYNISIVEKSEYKLFIREIPVGKGSRNILCDDTTNLLNSTVVALYGANNYEEFKRIFYEAIDPHKFSQCMSIEEIKNLLKRKGVTDEITKHPDLIYNPNV